MKKTSEILQEVHGLVRAGWCQKTNAGGKSPYDPDATVFCVYGALCHATGPGEQFDAPKKRVMSFLDVASASRGHKGAITMNDSADMTQDQMLEMILDAKLSAEKAGL